MSTVPHSSKAFAIHVLQQCARPLRRILPSVETSAPPCVYMWKGNLSWTSGAVLRMLPAPDLGGARRLSAWPPRPKA